MALRPELPEHAGRQIGTSAQLQTANQRLQHADPRVWSADNLQGIPSWQGPESGAIMMLCCRAQAEGGGVGGQVCVFPTETKDRRIDGE